MDKETLGNRRNMKKNIKLAIGIFVFVLILYCWICLYLYYQDQKNIIFKNNCLFNYTNCSYSYVYNFTNNLDKNYNKSINSLRDFIKNES